MASLSNEGLNRARQMAISSDTILVATDLGLFLFDGIKKYGFEKSTSAKYVLPFSPGIYMSGNASRVSAFNTKTRKETSLFIGRTTAAVIDSSDFIFLGSVDGVFSSVDGFTTNWGDFFTELKSRIVAMALDANRGLWVVTPTDGLLRVKTEQGKITAIEKINPLLKKPIENIQSLHVDDKGKVWMATNTGVYGIDHHYNTIHFNKNNGLSENDVNALIVKNDTLWAATVVGLSKIILSDKDFKADFSTVISALRYKVGDQDETMNLLDSISNYKKVVLHANASLVELDIAGLDYSSRGNMTYTCIVSKCLPHFSWVTFDNLLTYVAAGFKYQMDTTLIATPFFNFGVDMKPGKYILKVYAINPNGISSALPDAITIYKKPYWSQTIWTYLFIWIVFIFVAWRIASAFGENRRLLTKVSELRLQAIKSQINPHFIGNSINAIQQFFYPPDPVKASKYIETFTRLLRTTMDFSEITFTTVFEEMQYNEDYLKMIQLRFGERFQYEINIDENLGKDALFPAMIVQPLLENATIHGLSPTDVSVLKLEVSQNNNGKIVCCITDNGLGINHPKAQKNTKNTSHKSKGLALLETKVKTLNDLYNIDCVLEVADLSEINIAEHGTRATLSYFQPSK